MINLHVLRADNTQLGFQHLLNVSVMDDRSLISLESF